jgi:polar amino acid transport system substrate-binding protein
MLEGGKTFAVPTGTIADQFVLQRFPDAVLKYFNSVIDCALAVKDGKADAAAYDKPILQNIAAKNDGLTVLSEMLVDDQYGFAVQLQNAGLKKAMDKTLAELKSKGIYKDMMRRWFPLKGNPAAMPEIKSSGKNGILIFGTAAVTEPMSFYNAKRQIVGFDIELASYIAKKLDKKLEIIDMDFGGLLPALIAGKVDFIGAGISITKERAKKVLFSKSYYASGIAAIVKSQEKTKKTASSTKLSSIEKIKNKRIGVLLGSIHDAYAMKNFPKAKILQFQNVSDLLLALNLGKVDAAFFDDSALKEVFNNNKDLGVLAKDVFSADIAAGFNKENPELRKLFNTFLEEIKSNGVYNDMIDRWVNKGLTEMPKINSSNSNGSLRVGIVGDIGMPFIILKNGEFVGFEIELSKRFSAYLGKVFVPVDMQFGSMIASLSTRKVDMSTCSMMITEERQKQIDFSNPYYKTGVSIIARKRNITNNTIGKLKVLDDIADKKIGIFSGTIYDAYISKKYPKAVIQRFDSFSDLILSVSTGKVDVAMFDLITARLVLKKNPELGMLSDDILTMPLGVGFSKKNPNLTKDFNRFLKEIKEDGTWSKMEKRWLIDDPEAAVMPSFINSPEGKKLVVAVNINDLPYVAYMNGKYVGFDIEMIQTFAQRRKFNLEIITMDFPSLIAALAAGKADMITDGIAITKERGKQIDFSDSYADFRTAVIAPNKDLANHIAKESNSLKPSFFEKMSDSFYYNIVFEKRYLLIIDGFKITILISIFAALLGTLFGGLICFMRMSKQKILSSTAKIYISLLRGTPVLVLLMIIYYIVFASVNINPIYVAVFAFGLNFAAYVSEMFRTSIESIDRGQSEAGIAGGFTTFQTYLYIVIPQAMRHVLPVYKGEFVSLVKMTSIVGYIAVQDLTKASDIIRSRTFDAFFPLIMAAIIYLIIAWLLTWVLDYVEISVDPKRKRIKKEVEVKA